jgi:hypothetical protein
MNNSLFDISARFEVIHDCFVFGFLIRRWVRNLPVDYGNLPRHNTASASCKERTIEETRLCARHPPYILVPLYTFQEKDKGRHPFGCGNRPFVSQQKWKWRNCVYKGNACDPSLEFARTVSSRQNLFCLARLVST